MGIAKDMVASGLHIMQAQAVGGSSVATGLTGAGTTQADALKITSAVNVFGTVAAGTGGVLPVAALGDRVLVANQGANALLVYPAVGGKVNALAANAGFSVAAAKNVVFQCISGNGLNWLAVLSA